MNEGLIVATGPVYGIRKPFPKEAIFEQPCEVRVGYVNVVGKEG